MNATKASTRVVLLIVVLSLVFSSAPLQAISDGDAKEL